MDFEKWYIEDTKEELIKERKEILESFFLKWKKKKQKRLLEIDNQLDIIDYQLYLLRRSEEK